MGWFLFCSIPSHIGWLALTLPFKKRHTTPNQSSNASLFLSNRREHLHGRNARDQGHPRGRHARLPRHHRRAGAVRFRCVDTDICVCVFVCACKATLLAPPLISHSLPPPNTTPPNPSQRHLLRRRLRHRLGRRRAPCRRPRRSLPHALRHAFPRADRAGEVGWMLFWGV